MDRIDEWEDFFKSEEGGSNESSHDEEEAALACFFGSLMSYRRLRRGWQRLRQLCSMDEYSIYEIF
jgi:hypothetical protein